MKTVSKRIVVVALTELADAEYQRRVWLASDGPETSSLSEAVCNLFDDSGLGDVLSAQPVVFSDGIDALLRQLRKAIGSVNQLQPPTQLLTSPQMERIRALSGKALQALAELEPGGAAS